MKQHKTPYDLTLERRRGYLYARIAHPTIDRQMALEYLAEVMDECASARRKCVLIDRDIPEALSNGDMTAAMKLLASMSAGIRVAFVNKYVGIDETLRAGIEAATARNADFMYFTAIGEAESWLLSAPPRPPPIPVMD